MSAARHDMRDLLFRKALTLYFEAHGKEIAHDLDLLRHIRSLDDAAFEALASPAWRAASNRAGPRHTQTKRLGN